MELSHEMCRLIMYLASKGAIRRKKNGTPRSQLSDFSMQTIEACIDRKIVSYGDHFGTKFYLSAPGVRAVEKWLSEGVDASGEDLSPEDRAILRPTYWNGT